jgi:hypothetical protein
MKHMTAEARGLLVTAQEVARLRDATQLEVRDVALAALIHHFLRRAEEVEPSETGSRSPEMLPMADQVQKIMTAGEGELRTLDLVELARRGDSELTEYLDHVRRATAARLSRAEPGQ